MHEHAEERRSPRAGGADWWVYAVAVLLVLHLALFVTLQARPGWLGVVLWYVGPLGLAALALAVLAAGVVWSAIRRPFWRPVRGAGYLGIGLVLLISARAYRVYPSSYDDRPSAVAFRLPLDGPVTVAWGGRGRDVNYHVAAPDQRWAYDLLVTRDGSSYRGDGRSVEDYLAFELPVLAPADGVVHAVADGEPNLAIGGRWNRENAAGNHVVLHVAPREYLFIAHLQAGSITVQPGDRIRAGEVIGRVGNSGYSSEPHVHVHLQDTPELHFGEGIPMYFHSYRVGDQLIARGIPTGGVRDGRFVGEVVEQVVVEEVDERVPSSASLGAGPAVF